ncbi:hypothetical protein QTP99_10510 [Caldanaerobacter subterraneus KAk]|uniref:hypothetical protein n=1 Tax=Caldanaerobacter subterraneus TaxID=911092 RepID=UPI0032C167D2
MTTETLNKESLKDKILAAIGNELVYAMRTFSESDRERLKDALDSEPIVLERILTLIDTLDIIEGYEEDYPRWI